MTVTGTENPQLVELPPTEYITLDFNARERLCGKTVTNQQVSQDRNIYLAAPGNVADHVTIERQSESTIMLADGARDAYLGYVTLKVGTTWMGRSLCKQF